MKTRYFAVVAVLVGLGCAGSASNSASDGSPIPRRSSSAISEPEIAASSATNAYDLIQQLHPEFLRSSGATTSGSDTGLPDVYVNNVRFGDPSTLRNIVASNVHEIHFYRGAEAATKYGMQHPQGLNGIIEVTLKH